MSYRTEFYAALPHLDVYTISEDRILELTLFAHWEFLSESLGLRPSKWIDRQGDRMYAAVIYYHLEFDLSEPVLEDAVIRLESDIIGIRKPHSLSKCTFYADGRQVAVCTMLSSFIKRQVKGSNKKFSKVRDLWQAADFNEDGIERLLDRHHEVKSIDQSGEVVRSGKASRATDFNTADFMYFKNYVRYAKAGEWEFCSGGPTKLNCAREVFYYGNVDDGMRYDVVVDEKAPNDLVTTILSEDGRRIFLSLTELQEVDIPER